MHFCDWWHFGSGMGFVWPIILVAVFVIAVLYFTGKLGGKSSESPRDIIRKRYAKGEINKEEFEQKMKDLD